VHPGETIEHRLAVRLGRNGRQKARGLERAGDTGDSSAGYGERPEQARGEAHRGDHVLLLRIDFAHHAAEPAFGADLVGLAGVPDVHRAEMRPRRIEVANAMHDGEFALVPKPLHRREKRREAVVPVEPQYLVVTDSDRLPVIAVERVVVRDDRVEIVVAARELGNDQHGILFHRRHVAFLRSRQNSCVTRIDTRASPQSVAAVRRYVWWPPGRSPPYPSGSGPIPSPARPAPSWCRRRLPLAQVNRGTNRPAPPAPARPWPAAA